MQPASCDVRIQFGSYAAGVDRAAAATIDELLGRDPAVAGVTRSLSGREGEYALCIRTKSPVAAASLFERLVTSIPGPVTAPVTVTGPDRSYSAPSRGR